MAYTEQNFPSKKALKEAIAAGRKISVFQPGPFGDALRPGKVYLEGPHYPKPHKWYASAEIDQNMEIIPGTIK